MTDTAKLNRRQQAKAATRAKLLESARRLWAEAGTYEFFGIRDIAAGAGMSTGAVFANWSSKADLWREAMGYAPPVDCAAVRQVLRDAAKGPRLRDGGDRPPAFSHGFEFRIFTGDRMVSAAWARDKSAGLMETLGFANLYPSATIQVRDCGAAEPKWETVSASGSAQ